MKARCLFWTGGTVTDLDGDGQLDLLLAHGESAQQPISVFKVTQVCMCMCCLKQKRQHNNVKILTRLHKMHRVVKLKLVFGRVLMKDAAL